MKTYCFDLDNTLCLTFETDYEFSVPLEPRIRKVNGLFEQGNRIVIHTARGDLTGLDIRELTERQLSAWGVRYHELRMGKPFADFYIDDKAVLDLDFFSDGNR